MDQPLTKAAEALAEVNQTMLDSGAVYGQLAKGLQALVKNVQKALPERTGDYFGIKSKTGETRFCSCCEKQFDDLPFYECGHSCPKCGGYVCWKCCGQKPSVCDKCKGAA